MSTYGNSKGTDSLGFSESTKTRKNQTSQFYAQYVRGRVTVEGEYQRNLQDQLVSDPLSAPEVVYDSRGFYGAASYRISKRVEVGGYYSRFYMDWAQKLSDPANHIFDKVATVRLDLTNRWDVKVEGHFMNGYADCIATRGFYMQDNMMGFEPRTNLLVIRTGFQF
ncbi:MAG: hypothetical protein JOZ62_17825 [Acidobacteriaceae bacterium]|nr:hypothetical protein [Acidobacteriaceae bacterium]